MIYVSQKRNVTYLFSIPAIMSAYSNYD